MILQSLAELAKREGLLANPDYEPKAVAWIIAVGEAGRFLGLIPTASEGDGGKKAKGKVMAVPRRERRTSNPLPDFLVDKSEYVLGIAPKGGGTRLAEKFDLFRASVRDAFAATGAAELRAVGAFLESDAELGQAIEKVNADGYRSNDLFAFEVGGRFVHELPEVQTYFSRMRRKVAGADAQCLICGRSGPLADKHPALKIRGGTTSGVPLVSFNSDAFESHGLVRNENAPVCRDCADAYSTGLKRLLGDGYPELPRRWVSLSPDTTVVFWADGEASVLDLFSSYLDTPRVESVRALFESVGKGREAAEVSERFYCLILSGGQGRAALRSMHTGTVAEVQGNLRRYFESIDVGAEQPLPLKSLLRGLALQGKLENIPSRLAGEVFLAIVFGHPFPRALLARAIERCRAEQKMSRGRAALLRAYLIRNEELEVSVGLDRESTEPGYRLGRLMAVLERVQWAAQRNQTVAERYYGAASTRPATVFPRLMTLAQHHVAKLKPGLAAYHQKLLGEVMGGLSEFPSTLNLKEQGLFALGYYHQRFFKEPDDAEKEQAEGAEA